MTAIDVLMKVLSVGSLGGLALVAVGVLPFGLRGVAALTLVAFAWVYLMLVRIALLIVNHE